MLNSVIDTQITLSSFFLCRAVSLVLGFGTALVGMFREKHTRSFAVALTVLPVTVQVVIMLVNGNVGAGVALAGTFSLVRFRSAPGSAREIGVIFLAMAIGLATGMGYVVLAVLFFVVVAAATLALTLLNFGGESPAERSLRITIPENLDYDGLFDDLFRQYTSDYTLEKVKTVNRGTLYELHYWVTLKTPEVPKAFLDEIRCRNGNLNVTCGREVSREAL